MSPNKSYLSSFVQLVTVSIVIGTVAFVPHLGVSAQTTGPNVQVNQVFDGPFPTNKQNEPSLAQNPIFPDNLIAG
jgi:hypothetical protein